MSNDATCFLLSTVALLTPYAVEISILDFLLCLEQIQLMDVYSILKGGRKLFIFLSFLSSINVTLLLYFFITKRSYWKIKKYNRDYTERTNIKPTCFTKTPKDKSQQIIYNLWNHKLTI